MRLLLLAVMSIGIVVSGCSDGKLNMLLVFWNDHEYSSSSNDELPQEEPLSSSIIALSSSSEPVFSSSEELSSSSEELSSSFEESSSSRGIRSSSSKGYEDYPTIEEGAPGVLKTQKTTRYWDGCKPTCSWLDKIGNPQPWTLARSCDRDGVNEMPAFYLSPANYNPPYHIGYLGTPNACVSDNRTQEWPQSSTYAEWKLNNPNFPGGDAHTCFDMAPYAVNDTLAYAFAATDNGLCGECFMLQFNGDWAEDVARPTHRALKGKTLIVMANNTGVGERWFDIMIPGGGLGDYDGFSVQLGMSPEENAGYSGPLGLRTGGLLSECIFGTLPSNPNNPDYSPIGVGLNSGWTSTLEDFQTCLRAKCHRVFDKQSPHLLRGCLWHADWFMAADNPIANYIKIECPKYLVDKYRSTIDTSPPKRPEGHTGTCMVDGFQCSD